MVLMPSIAINQPNLLPRFLPLSQLAKEQPQTKALVHFQALRITIHPPNVNHKHKLTMVDKSVRSGVT